MPPRPYSASEPAPKDVDSYIRGAPKSARPKLEQVRGAIRDSAPDAIEGISYKMPYYNYRGRLAWFALQTEFIGLYIRPPVVEEHAKELKKFVTTKSAVHFPLSEKIPVQLIQKLIKAAVLKNDGR